MRDHGVGGDDLALQVKHAPQLQRGLVLVGLHVSPGVGPGPPGRPGRRLRAGGPRAWRRRDCPGLPCRRGPGGGRRHAGPDGGDPDRPAGRGLDAAPEDLAVRTGLGQGRRRRQPLLVVRVVRRLLLPFSEGLVERLSLRLPVLGEDGLASKSPAAGSIHGRPARSPCRRRRIALAAVRGSPQRRNPARSAEGSPSRHQMKGRTGSGVGGAAWSEPPRGSPGSRRSRLRPCTATRRGRTRCGPLRGRRRASTPRDALQRGP